MALGKEHTEFLMREICTINPKRLEIDREFTNLLPRLKYEGYPITTAKRKLITIDDLTDAVGDDSLHFGGFKDHRTIVYRWLESDFLSVVNRGNTDKQQVAAPLPMHLNTYKLRNSKFNKDYGVADQIFSLLFHGAREVMNSLRDFLLQGADYFEDKYDGKTDLDIETLLMMRILDQTERDYPDHRKQPEIPVPLCLGQARILGDDIARLLAYQHDIPRLVLIGYIKNVMALHIGIYILRLFQIVPDLVKRGAFHPTCRDCPVRINNEKLFDTCAFPVQIIADMGEDYRTHMAELARQQFNTHREQLNEYVRAHLVLKKLQEFAIDQVQRRRILLPQTLEEILALRNYNDQLELKTFFEIRNRSLISVDGDEQDERLLAIRRLGLNELDTYLEMVYLLRQSFHQKYYTLLLDSLFQKTSEAGLLRQGYGRINRRRYSLGSGLLETLVQIAVLEPTPTGGFRTHSMRIDDFIEWLRRRYGIYISRLPVDREATLADLEALRLNVQAFKDRLREIGFYTDLSDAFVSQVIRPRYLIEQETIR